MCKGAKFYWSAACELAFIKFKNEICSDRVLVQFDASLSIRLTTDDSPCGIAAVFSHEINGEDKANCGLTKAEQRYSQLDREVLTIVLM